LSQDLFKCSYFETSAKDDKNVQDCFSKIIELINENVEAIARQEFLSQINSNRRNSTMSFVRRISISTSPKRNMLARRYSEPAVGNNGNCLKIALETKARIDEEEEARMNRKKVKNCVIS
jgi:hypothetical protein